MNRLIAMSLAAGLALASGSGPARGASQPADKPAEKPAAQPAAKPVPPQPPMPSLDDLLNIKPAGKPGDATTPPPPGDASKADMERRLKDGDVEGGFSEAIALMSDAAKRLAVKDTGIDTQRTQEDILRQLDKLISDARKQQQKKQQQQQQPSQPQPQAGEQSQDASRAEGQATNTPGRRDGALRPGLGSARAAWGSLPARLRDMLMQGSGEKFSTTYERLTEEYYRRLAERKD